MIKKKITETPYLSFSYTNNIDFPLLVIIIIKFEQNTIQFNNPAEPYTSALKPAPFDRIHHQPRNR